MADTNDAYSVIKDKIDAMKQKYPSMRSKSDDYVFSAVCVKANLYKNPALILNDLEFDDIIVDGQYDGGVDVMLTDPNSDESDLVIGQSKFYHDIKKEDILNAVMKMVRFYNDMCEGHYESVNDKVQRRFLTLNSETGEESKIRFVFYTSALQRKIRKNDIEKKFREQFDDFANVELIILFGNDIVEEIQESESRRPSVEFGKLRIDHAGNCLYYGDDAAVMVNVSAFSVKSLYAMHNNNLLAKNLRYHIAGRTIDNDISDTIRNNPDTFWFKNNGLTIICDNFAVDGKEVKLWNFSIINGGQTTYMIHKSTCIDETQDLFLPCKIVKAMGNTEDEKNAFGLSIAKATNLQKAIKPVDLKANSPEQVRFGQAMREAGIFYQTKRGETVPKEYKDASKNTALMEVGKLCLAAIFQRPCLSRAQPSTLHQPKYYERIFNTDQVQVAKLCRELLYMNCYFKDVFQKKMDKEYSQSVDGTEIISFIHNARTICLAFVAFSSRYVQGNITSENLQRISRFVKSEAPSDDDLYDIFSDIKGVQYFIPPAVFNDKDRCDRFLDELFRLIIRTGNTSFKMARIYDGSVNATNFLKIDKNYYTILVTQWDSSIEYDIKRIYREYM